MNKVTICRFAAVPPIPIFRAFWSSEETKLIVTPEAHANGGGRLDGRVAVVTGEGHGIGAASAARLAADGATVAVCDIRTDGAADVATRINRDGGRAEAFTADVADPLAYNTSKAAIINLTRQLAADFSREGIRVNCVCPGWIRTGFNDPLFEGRSEDAIQELVERQVPLGRQGTGEEIADAVAFLVSDDARYVNAHALVVDGGLTATNL
jgi:NAD(P)-dependent dehydrogenase (short-subunit alcohol dehydrogenase family)